MMAIAMNVGDVAQRFGRHDTRLCQGWCELWQEGCNMIAIAINDCYVAPRLGGTDSRLGQGWYRTKHGGVICSQLLQCW